MNRIEKSKYFILLLLHTQKSQAKALLETASPAQVLAISEVAHNICENPDIKLKNTSKRQQLIIKQLGDRKLKEKAKYKLLCKEWRLVWDIIVQVRSTLIKLLT